jgi:hypothetical protein
LTKRATKRGLIEYPSEYFSLIQEKENVMQTELPTIGVPFLGLHRFLTFLDYQVSSNYYKMDAKSEHCLKEKSLFPIYQLDTSKQSFSFFGESVFLKI